MMLLDITKLEPTTIKYVDFFAEKQFEWMEIPENRMGFFQEVKTNIVNTIKYWVTVVRATLFNSYYCTYYVRICNSLQAVWSF
jgi:hypothetical protein